MNYRAFFEHPELLGMYLVFEENSGKVEFFLKKMRRPRRGYEVFSNMMICEVKN